LGELCLHGIYTNFLEYKSDHVVVFRCSDFTLTGATDREIERLAFFPLDHLPDDIAAGHKRRIREFAGGSNVPTAGMW
jgi:hypothetical protein